MNKPNADSIHTSNDLGLPPFIRLPPSGSREKNTGLSRSALNSLILPTAANDYTPPVRSIVLKSNRKASRGIRMILTASLMEFLESLVSKGPPPK